MPKFGMGRLPCEQLVSPPSPTAHWEKSQRIGVQGIALQAGHQGRSAGHPLRLVEDWTCGGSRRAPCIIEAGWWHDICRIDRGAPRTAGAVYPRRELSRREAVNSMECQKVGKVALRADGWRNAQWPTR